jgi:hypothetical protein
MLTDIDHGRREDHTFDRLADSSGPLRTPSLRGAWRLLLDGLIQSVPEEDAFCEFDCRRRQCLLREWMTCERRLQAVAAQLRFSGRSETYPGH